MIRGAFRDGRCKIRQTEVGAVRNGLGCVQKQEKKSGIGKRHGVYLEIQGGVHLEILQGEFYKELILEVEQTRDVLREKWVNDVGCT